MSGWTSRRDARGAPTFIAYSEHDIELLVPPGGRVPVEPAQVDAGGSGLWTHASWSRDADAMLELDAPRTQRRLRTAAAVAMLGDELRGEVAALMRRQLELARTLCSPRGRRPLEDRRAHAHAMLLMALTDELGEAFPSDRFWQLRCDTELWTVSVDFDELVARLCESSRPRRRADDTALSTRLVARALVRAVWVRLSRREGVTAAELWGWVGEPDARSEPDAAETSDACLAEEGALLPPR